MAKESWDGAKIGAMEARWSTRNALTGHKDAHDMRSRDIANPNEELQAFTPGQLKVKEELRGLSHGADFKQAREADEINQLLMGQRSAFQDVMRADVRMQLEPQIWAAYDRILGKEGKEQVLKAIEAKVSKAEQVQAGAMDKVQATAEIQAQANSLLAQAPEALLIAGGAGLALWVIKKLPMSAAFKVVSLGVVMSIVLAACGTAAGTPEGQLPPASGPVATETAGVSIATETATATAEPSPTATEVVMTLDQQIDAFASGKIEFPSDLSPEEYSAFIDGMNDKVGRQPIWVEGLNSKTGAKVVLYFDVTKNKMVDLPGTYAENKAIIDQNVLEMFVELSVEPGTGNIQFINSNGELVTSPNSAGTDWNLRVDDSNYKNGLIELPTILEPRNPDFAAAWWDKLIAGIGLNNQARKTVLMPGILMDTTVSRLVSKQGGWNPYPCVDIMFIRTDTAGNPIYGVRTMVGPAPSNFVGEEGVDLNLGSDQVFLQDTDDIKRFEAGAVYYIGIPKGQQVVWDENNKADIDELQGVDSESGSFDNAFNQDVPNDGNIILAGNIFIKKK